MSKYKHTKQWNKTKQDKKKSEWTFGIQTTNQETLSMTEILVLPCPVCRIKCQLSQADTTVSSQQRAFSIDLTKFHWLWRRKYTKKERVPWLLAFLLLLHTKLWADTKAERGVQNTRVTSKNTKYGKRIEDVEENYKKKMLLLLCLSRFQKVKRSRNSKRFILYSVPDIVFEFVAILIIHRSQDEAHEKVEIDDEERDKNERIPPALRVRRQPTALKQNTKRTNKRKKRNKTPSSLNLFTHIEYRSSNGFEHSENDRRGEERERKKNIWMKQKTRKQTNKKKKLKESENFTTYMISGKFAVVNKTSILYQELKNPSKYRHPWGLCSNKTMQRTTYSKCTQNTHATASIMPGIVFNTFENTVREIEDAYA